MGVQISKSIDVYRKVDVDLTRASATGAFFSVIGLGMVFFLCVMEVSDYFTPSVTSSVTMDDGLGGDSMQQLPIHFNISIERIPCPYISIQLHNSLGTHMLNITKNIHRYKLKTKSGYTHATAQAKIRLDFDPSLDLNGGSSQLVMSSSTEDEEVKPTLVLNTKQLDAFVLEHRIALVQFFAPWCVWCQRLAPVWTSLANEIEAKHTRNQIGVAWVDCTKEESIPVCHSNHVVSFPTIVAFKAGNSHTSDAYHGDRSVSALLQFAKEELVQLPQMVEEAEMDDSARIILQKELEDKLDGDDEFSTAVEGCRLEGYVLVPKVPGTLVFKTEIPHQTLDLQRVNCTHKIHSLTLGAAAADDDGLATNPLRNRLFRSPLQNLTHEHFLKIVPTVLRTLNNKDKKLYRYLHYASPFHANDEAALPVIKMHFDFAAVQVVIEETAKPFYRFMTNLFAILGGTFTFFGMLDSLTDRAHQAFKQKKLM